MGHSSTEEDIVKLGLALLRSIVGFLFLGHGLQKLAGWFGGHGLEGTGQFFESLGLRPGKRHAALSGAAEAGGGALLALGLLTPAAAAMISGSMLVAIRKVHLPNGPWVSDGGYEYNLALLAIVFALTDLGPGEWSLDEALGIELRGPVWALAELGAGVAGSYAVTYLSEQYSAQQPPAAFATPEAAADPASPGNDPSATAATA
jgi:putative oxidoreductase